jgi:hypothetical protein
MNTAFKTDAHNQVYQHIYDGSLKRKERTLEQMAKHF